MILSTFQTIAWAKKKSIQKFRFSGTLKPLKEYWRIQGLCIAIFLDDGWAIVRDRESCRIKVRDVRADLCNAGFVVNDDKSVWEPKYWIGWV